MSGEKKVSKKIINCITQLPYKIEKTVADDTEGNDPSCWSIVPISGNSALQSSLKYLNESPQWDHHIIAWTGEIVGSDENPDKPMYLTQDEKKVVATMLQGKEAEGSTNTVHPVWLLRKDQYRWRKFAESVIWPALHYILNPPDDGTLENVWWYDYVKFNEAYAMKVAQIYEPGDIIWVHDYYLMLLPQLLRMRFNNATIAYFHDTPWPSNEYFRCLSRRKPVLDGLLGANRICFQNDGFARHFVSGCQRLLGCTASKSSNSNSNNSDEYRVTSYGGDVLVDSLPIGVDTEQITRDAFSPDVDEKVNAIRKAYEGKKIIIGRDRLDSVKGVLQKLQAYQVFLAMYPEWRGKVVLIQVSGHTARTDANIKLESQVNDLVASINSQYGNLNYDPVQHYYLRIPQDVYYSLLRGADVCLVTSVRDGMNTTALEFVTVKSQLSKYNCYASPLILSEFSGASTVLTDAIIVNPWDAVAVSKAINKALRMSPAQKESLELKLRKEVPTIQDWTDRFLKTVTDQIERKTGQEKITPALNRPLLLRTYKNAARRLFLFDYDGTLTPIVKDPAAAIPSARLYNILTKLAQDPKNKIWLISGRDQQFLSRYFGTKIPQLGLSAEHGCFMKDVGSEEWVNLTAKVDMSWQKDVGDVMESFTKKTPGSSIERKKVALTWHYRQADPELGKFNAEAMNETLIELTKGMSVEVMEGKANIEVRPSFVNKGEIVRRLVWTPHGSKQIIEDEFSIDENVLKEELPEFIFCLGDDVTDEDMFDQLNHIEKQWDEKYPEFESGDGFGIYPVTVGSASKKTVAKAYLTDPQQVLDTLGLLVGDVSLFQSAGTVDLDDRGHLKDSESSLRSEQASVAYAMKRSTSSNNTLKKTPPKSN
ncbi:unnamed protein product [Kluyveromyces dobzhanskii CBS 2104]|uniref:WGS project CCBQ000000000 data, contig 00014 n=1 Tax=Kluyveromyces dobzhanskii CBS 2104 TaxID=1427455 RepID=A0A0A8L6Y1_9SACH|nr:unnamed protein product [Kluyveromyces dobzhanskii CBS 2104]